MSWEIFRNLELAAFADAGSLGEDSSTFFQRDDLRYAVGLGLRYRLPVGPLRIDYGVNPDRHEGESFGALHVTFGFSFRGCGGPTILPDSVVRKRIATRQKRGWAMKQVR